MQEIQGGGEFPRYLIFFPVFRNFNALTDFSRNPLTTFWGNLRFCRKLAGKLWLRNCQRRWPNCKIKYNNRSLSQISLLWNPHVPHRVHNSSLLHVNSVCICVSHLRQFNITTPSRIWLDFKSGLFTPCFVTNILSVGAVLSVSPTTHVANG